MGNGASKSHPPFSSFSTWALASLFLALSGVASSINVTLHTSSSPIPTHHGQRSVELTPNFFFFFNLGAGFLILGLIRSGFIHHCDVAHLLFTHTTHHGQRSVEITPNFFFFFN